MKLLASKLINEKAQRYIKNGILTPTLELTEKGRRLLETFAFEAYEAELEAYMKRQAELAKARKNGEDAEDSE